MQNIDICFVSSGILNRQYYLHLFWCSTTEMSLTVKIFMFTFFVLNRKLTLHYKLHGTSAKTSGDSVIKHLEIG